MGDRRCGRRLLDDAPADAVRTARAAARTDSGSQAMDRLAARLERRLGRARGCGGATSRPPAPAAEDIADAAPALATAALAPPPQLPSPSLADAAPAPAPAPAFALSANAAPAPAGFALVDLPLDAAARRGFPPPTPPPPPPPQAP